MEPVGDEAGTVSAAHGIMAQDPGKARVGLERRRVVFRHPRQRSKR